MIRAGSVSGFDQDGPHFFLFINNLIVIFNNITNSYSNNKDG
jgi:hypothetical protein